MPEGHTIHRLARLHRRALVGRAVAADSPQGRFAQSAAELDGRVVLDVEAHGKHLFHRFAGPLTLHVHLGLFGGWRTFDPPGPLPPASTRLRLRTDEVVLHLSGPAACELVDPAEEERLRRRLGPDPLRDDADPTRAWAALQRRRAPVGAALLDQGVLAGVGNVYRAEALFACGISPDRPAREVTAEEWACLWATVRAMLQAGERTGRIVTVDPAAVGAADPAAVPDAERFNVYRRSGQPCRRCGTSIARWELGARPVHACPGCQR